MLQKGQMATIAGAVMHVLHVLQDQDVVKRQRTVPYLGESALGDGICDSLLCLCCRTTILHQLKLRQSCTGTHPH